MREYWIILNLEFFRNNMARRRSIIKLKLLGCALEDQKTDIWPTGEKGTLSRIADDPAFQRTLGRMVAEFGRGQGRQRTLRTALQTLLLNSAESRMVELTQIRIKVIKLI
jgi:hypothetical protein